MGLLPDTYNCGLCMRRECWDRFPRQRLQMKPLDSDRGMHHGTCVTHVPWCMSGSLTRDGGVNVPGIPGACTTRNCTYLARGPYSSWLLQLYAYWLRDVFQSNCTLNFTLGSIFLIILWPILCSICIHILKKIALLSRTKITVDSRWILSNAISAVEWERL